MATRRASKDEDLRLLYGVGTHLPFQQHCIHVNETDDESVINSRNVCIASLEACSELIKEGKIRRGTYYMTMVMMPLIAEPKPYCIGIYCVSKGSNADILVTVHQKLLSLGSELGIRIVTLPGRFIS